MKTETQPETDSGSEEVKARLEEGLRRCHAILSDYQVRIAGPGALPPEGTRQPAKQED